MQNRIVIVCLFVVAACGGGSGGEAKPIDAAVDAFESTCGAPGDLGNEMGIGKFCASLGDCSDTQAAPLCSSLGDPTTHFCTKTCRSTDPAGTCGTAAECVCNGNNQCGCTPSSCL